VPLLGLPLTGGDGPPGDPVVTMPLAADLVVRTKLEPPRPRRRQLARPRLDERLRQARDYRLTVVHAPTGYGKSTALAAALADRPALLFWYTITEPDHDPLLFLLHLVFSFHARLPQVAEKPAALLAEGDLAVAQRPALDALINGLAQALPDEACLVLDDYHLVSQVPESRRGATMGFTATTNQVGLMIGAAVGGLLLALWGYAALGVQACCTSLAAAACCAVAARMKGRAG